MRALDLLKYQYMYSPRAQVVAPTTNMTGHAKIHVFLRVHHRRSLRLKPICFLASRPRPPGPISIPERSRRKPPAVMANDWPFDLY